MENYEQLYSITMNVLHLQEKSNSRNEFFTQFCMCIQKVLNCEGVAVFLTDHREEFIHLEASTGTEWYSSEKRFYRVGECVTGEVCKNKSKQIATLSSREWKKKEKSYEVVTNKNIFSYIWVPICDTENKNLGVIRCRNKCSHTTGDPLLAFSDADVSKLNTFSQSVCLYVLQEKKYSEILRHVNIGFHDIAMNMHIVDCESMVLQENLKKNRLVKKNILDSLGIIFSAIRIILRLQTDLQIRVNEKVINNSYIHAKKTNLEKVIYKGINNLEYLLGARKFASENIITEGFANIPMIWIDCMLFEQLIYNLLLNSIEYNNKNPDTFRVKIICLLSNDFYIIKYCDWRPGILHHEKEIIFEEGYHSNSDYVRCALGQGMGLWYSRKIVELHDGCLELTNQESPTEFSIYLPRYLERRPPTNSVRMN